MNAPLDRIQSDAAECLARHERNLGYWREKSPALIKMFAGRESRVQDSGIAWMDNGEINVRVGDHWQYEPNARAFAEAQVENFSRNPSRVVFSRPNLEIVEAKTAVADAPDEVYLTRKYDDRADDFHFAGFTAQCNRAFNDAGYEMAEKITQQRPYYLVIYGLGLGYHIRPLIERYRPTMVILVESQLDALWRSTFTFDWREMNDYCSAEDIRVKLIVDGNARTIVQKIGGMIHGESLLGLDGVVSLLHHNDPAMKVAYNDFQSPKTANLASFIGFITDEYNMMKNSFRNLRSGTRRVLKKAAAQVKIPVLILGSGPSLEDNIERVKQLRERMLIIASGSCLKVLLKNGIRPDFHCNLERARSILVRHEELTADGFGEDLKQIYAVMTTTIWPGIDAYFKDTVYFLRPALSPVGVFCEEGDQVLANEGPQVTNTAFAFAKRLGANEIYLLGVDLGATDPKRPRAGDAWQAIRPRALNIPVRGNFGRTVFTDMQLIQQKETLQEQIAKVAKAGGKVFNLGNGARIEGALAKRIEELDLPEPGFDRAAHARELIEQFPVYTRERFVGAWLSARVRENVANIIEGMIGAVENAKTWDYKLVKKLEDYCSYVGKPLREQYAPRLVRGSVLRMFMHVNSLLLRLKDQAAAEDAWAALRPVLVEHLRNIEMEAYSLADELESEDEAFAARFG